MKETKSDDDSQKQTSKERSHRYSAERKTKSSSKLNDKSKDLSSSNEKDEIKADEEEAKNIEKLAKEEKLKDEEEAKKAEEEEELQEILRLEKEKKLALEARQAAIERIENRLKLREKNLNAAGGRPDETFFKSLDSSMKKNTTFVKKLRTMTEHQRDSLSTEFSGLNLNKFIQEAVTSIIEAKLKVADVSVAANMCSLFHLRYIDFMVLFKKAFPKLFQCTNCKEEEKPTHVSKLRTSTRLLGELILDGAYGSLEDGVNLLINILQAIVNNDQNSFVFAPVILTIVRHCGEDLAGIVPRKYRRWKETVGVDFPVLDVVSSDHKSLFLCIFREYYENMTKFLVAMHKDLQNRDRQNQQTIGLKGELTVERKEAYEKAQKVYEKLLASTTSLAEFLDEEMPDLPEDEQQEREEMGTINIFTPVKGVEYDAETGLWEDEDTRSFYECIKDLKILVPQILFKDAPGSSGGSSPGGNTNNTQKKKPDKKKTKDRKLRVDLNLDDDMNDFDDMDDNYEQDILDDVEGEDDDSHIGGMAALAEAYFAKLPNCVNRDFIDEAAEEFIMKLNTKTNRKKLVRALFSVSRTRLDLLPFYSRLVSTLAPCLPDVGQDLVFLLKGSFRSHLRKKDQIHTESKIKTVRFIGELTKFKVCPKAETLHCLKLLLDNFLHHNIDMACNLLETCGRFLYRSPESNPRMAMLLEQLLRKKSVQALDSRHNTMIENAFYYCNPPERTKVQKKVRPPIHEYIRKLLYKDLSKTTTEKVLRQMRKLPWNNTKVKTYASKCIMNVWNLKFNNIRCLANMLSGLAEYHEDVAVSVIDGLLEYIRIGMETNFFRDNQRRLSTVKFLGEMYNYQLVDSDVVFICLYMLITFGASIDMSEGLDPPEHLFRVRLVCTILDTCGQYFDRGSSKKKMDCFLVYFQCYIWEKKESGYWNDKCPFPRDLDYMVNDSIEALRPKMELFVSLDEAKAAVLELNKEYEDKIKAIATLNESLDKSDNESLSTSNLSSSPFAGSPMAFSPGIQSQSSQDEEENIHSSEFDSANEDDEENEQQEHRDDENMFMMDDDEEVRLRVAPRYQQCEEDDAFIREFDRVLGESISNRLQDNMKTPNVDIAIPMNLKGKQKKNSSPSISEQTAVVETKKQDGVNFVLMLKKNNKQVLKDLKIPLSSDLAANIHNKQMAERAEHEEMKRLVLDYNQRQEEESYNELMSQFRPTRRGGHHPRGGNHQSQKFRPTNTRLRSFDSDQHLFSPTNRR